jgi:hypothetical protein
MKWLCIILVVCSSLSGYAQEKEVRVTGQGTHTNIGREDLPDPVAGKISEANDSLLKRKEMRYADSLRQLVAGGDGQRVYSQKQWRQFKDSLSKIPAINLPGLQEIPKHEVDEQQLIHAINEKFYGRAMDSTRAAADGTMKGLQDPKSALQSSLPGQSFPGASMPDVTGQLPKDLKLESMKLPDASLGELPPLPAHVMPTKYLKGLDSIRNLKLKEDGLRLKEQKVAGAREKIASVTKRDRIWDKSYLEGVLGFAPGDHMLVQASPTIGYHFMPSLSLGAGPNVLIRENQGKILTTVGLKAFFKAEFLKRQGYIQLEDIMDSYGTGNSESGKRSIFEQHHVYAGGGWLLTLAAPVSLNFSILYGFNSSAVPHEFSPFVFRVGISSIKSKK